MNPTSMIVFSLIIWLLFGTLTYSELTARYPNGLSTNRSAKGPTIDESNATVPQLVFLYLLCGPIIWVYGIWKLLGLWGK